MKAKPGDRTLDMHWSQAIKQKYGGRCAGCGDQGLQAHHIIKRRFKLTRWLVSNGVWLCLNCHRAVETNLISAQDIKISEDDKAALSLWSKWTLKDWCQQNEMTTNDFRADRLKELKAYVNR